MTSTIPCSTYKIINYIDNTINKDNYKQYYNDLIDNIIYYNCDTINIIDKSNIYNNSYLYEPTDSKRPYLYFTEKILKPYYSNNIICMGFFILSKKSIFSYKKYKKYVDHIMYASSHHNLFNIKNKHIIIPKPYIVYASTNSFMLDKITDDNEKYLVSRYLSNITGVSPIYPIT